MSLLRASLATLLLAAAVPLHANVFFTEGMKAVEAGDWEGAVALLERAVAAEPDDLRIGTEYRQAVIAVDDYDRCIAFLEELVAEHPRAANLRLNVGYAHIDKIPAEGAITGVILANTAIGHFTAALELEETWLGLFTRGNSYLFWPAIFGRAPLGVADMERAIELAEETARKPYHVRVWVGLGDGYWRLGELEKAVETWRRGLGFFPGTHELEDRLSREGEELDEYLEAYFDPGVRVDTSLREIWAAP